MNCRNCELLDQRYNELQSGFEALDRKFVAASERVASLEFDKKTLFDANQLAHQGWGEMEKELNGLEAENARLREALEGIVAESHSWVIREETANIESPIHERYRGRAKKALSRQAADRCEHDVHGTDCVQCFPTLAEPVKESAQDDRTWPCYKCGKQRTKAEGGSIFTLCDSCWDKHFNTDTAQGGSENG